MVRVGFVRWFIQVALRPENNGQTSINLALIPQGKVYRSLVKQWHGVHAEIIEKDVPVIEQSVRQVEDTWGLKANKIMAISIQLADELASRVVKYCTDIGIVDYAEYNPAGAIWLVKTAILRAIETNNNDAIERVEKIDLIQNMKDCRLERERQQIERERIERERYAAHLAEQNARYEAERPAREAREKAEKEVRETSLKTSMDLLYSFLNSKEKKEAEMRGCVTINNLAGTFVVPVSAHGLVEHYENGNYKASYCIVFQDYSIPVGDEALMKVALLKADPKKFFQTANKFDKTFHRGFAPLLGLN